MAALCAPLKILLLWAGLVCLANCQTITVTTPTPAIIPPSPTTNATIKSIDSQANTTQNPTSPTNTTSNSTVTAATKAPTPAPPTPPPLCSYTVTSIKFGLQINIISSTNGNFTININEKGRPGPGMEFDFQRSNQTSSRTIDHLKPCTEYEHNVTFIGSDGNETPCNHCDTRTGTFEMSPGDINVTVGAASCIPGSVCYQSHWDISSSLRTSNKNPPEQCKSDNKTFCIKPDFNDTCSDLTTTFTSGNCADSSFNITTNIPVDPSEIKQEPVNQLPARINTFSPNCVGLSVDYTCQEKEKPNESKKLSELEPFTDYSCTGQVNNNNNVTITNTTAVKVLINCDIKIINIQKRATQTTIDLSWTTISLNCRNLPTLEKLSYDCSCSPAASRWKHSVSKDSAGGSCRVTGLETFTNYTCDIQPTYNNKDAGQPTQVIKKTEIGNDDSFIVRLFFYIAFIIYVVLNVVIYKIYVWRLRKSTNDVNEDVMLDSTASYENDPQSEERL